jgi:hypothetical protein
LHRESFADPRRLHLFERQNLQLELRQHDYV